MQVLSAFLMGYLLFFTYTIKIISPARNMIFFAIVGVFYIENGSMIICLAAKYFNTALTEKNRMFKRLRMGSI
jgi:hypothetical protein